MGPRHVGRGVARMCCSPSTGRSGFNGSTARGPWCRLHGLEHQALGLAASMGPRHPSRGLRQTADLQAGGPGHASMGPRHASRGVDADQPRQRRAGAEPSTGPRHPSRGVGGEIKCCTPKIHMLQWGHGTQAVVSDRGGPRCALAGKASMGPRHPSRGVGRSRAGCKVGRPGFNGSTAPKPWCRCVPGIGRFVLSVASMGSRHPSRGVGPIAHPAKAVVIASMGPRHPSRGVGPIAHPAKAVVIASMGPRHPSRGVAASLVRRAAKRRASMGPRHPSRGVA